MTVDREENKENKKNKKHLPYYYEEQGIDTYFSDNKVKIPETEKVRLETFHSSFLCG